MKILKNEAKKEKKCTTCKSGMQPICFLRTWAKVNTEKKVGIGCAEGA